MKQTVSKKLYFSLILVTVVFIVYVLGKNLVLDPQFTEFLSHKTKLSSSFVMPAWLSVVRVHIIFGCIAMLSGVANFSMRLLKRNRLLHRVNGIVYLLAVIAVIFTSGYLAPHSTGGKVNSIAFNLLNIVWLVFSITAYIAIKRRNITSHRKWMVRSYVFCFTNMLTHILLFISHDWLGFNYEASYTFGVYGSIVINLTAAKIVNRFVFKAPVKLLPNGLPALDR
ncbi:DUF2306 domain-containing protein [Paenibacillus ehimensis]|uniref:DUF2306 domain-containing protein n=1 Tax=Paenibacillus ehimensis TaxID=79264 RepID=A0ABT8V9F5_9BACL|nr:DUF2306 domain-containing protein [Paenibacillus ehimensis]MDO3676806.1 DUF2306 domain-containing protein [Paenibacillus ehimensis]